LYLSRVSEASTHKRRAHDTLHMSSDATHTAMTAPSGDTTTATTPASPTDAGEAIPGLLNDIVVTHILRSENFDDPADLTRLPVVSRAMRDAVASTGLRLKELDEDDALNLGCLSALQRLALAGRLSRREILCRAAACVGNLEKLQALREDGWLWDDGTCTDAAMGGHLEVLQWARANVCPWNKRTCTVAAGNGRLDVLQWSRANGYPWNEWTCAGAAKGGHLEVLQWLRANGCPWDANTCHGAVMGGHLEVLQWARANGCPWDIRTCHKAAEGGHLEMLLWARKNGCPCGETELHLAALKGLEALVRALMEAGADVNKARDDGATRCSSPLIRATRRWCGR